MTKNTRSQLDDQAFLSRFEDQTLDQGSFNHLGHLRLAWLYLERHDVATAIRRTCASIENYATSKGATTKFHLTITNALVRLIAARMQSMQDRSWPGFVAQNRDLVEDAVLVLGRHFSKSRLFSEQARITLVEPDLLPLDNPHSPEYPLAGTRNMVKSGQLSPQPAAITGPIRYTAGFSPASKRDAIQQPGTRQRDSGAAKKVELSGTL
jgi:hypothetical protein